MQLNRQLLWAKQRDAMRAQEAAEHQDIRRQQVPDDPTK
jgi:hypothetical protein